MSQKEDYLFLKDEIPSNNNEKLKIEYIAFINYLYNERQLSKKVFYIVINEEYSDKKIKIAIENLEEKYKTINNLLSKCGNQVTKIDSYVEIEKILKTVFT